MRSRVAFRLPPWLSWSSRATGLRSTQARWCLSGCLVRPEVEVRACQPTRHRPLGGPSPFLTEERDVDRDMWIVLARKHRPSTNLPRLAGQVERRLSSALGSSTSQYRSPKGRHVPERTPPSVVWVLGALYRNGAVHLTVQLARRFAPKGCLAIVQTLEPNKEVRVPPKRESSRLVPDVAAFVAPSFPQQPAWSPWLARQMSS